MNLDNVSEYSDLAIYCWTSTGDYGKVYFNLIKQLKLRFDAEGISIAFPQRDLHILSGNMAKAA